MRKIGILTLTLFLSVGLTAAADRWLHVRVQEGGADDQRVSVNIPLQLVEQLLPTIETEELRGGRVNWTHHGELDGIDLHQMLEALRDAPDGEFVTVRSRSENVRVAKERGFLLVNADDDGDKVRVRMPLGVIDAMLGAGEEELDLVAALQALAQFDGEDLVTVESDDTFVRIWIDSSDTGE